MSFLLDTNVISAAEVHRWTRVTRNVQDFLMLGISLLNPWQAKK